jgi:hypothetical protein
LQGVGAAHAGVLELRNSVHDVLLKARQPAAELGSNIADPADQGLLCLANGPQKFFTGRPNTRRDRVNSRLQGLVPRHTGRLIGCHTVGNLLLNSRKALAKSSFRLAQQRPKLTPDVFHPARQSGLSLTHRPQKFVTGLANARCNRVNSRLQGLVPRHTGRLIGCHAV